ncbi:MAG: EAL domain-containing protein [Gemmatimonadetes bacterium]|nr:EAL domain-containing protein [Gemmatimonadota bacterium]
MLAEAEEARTIKEDLALALVRQEFVLHFQPIVDITTGHTVAFEALVRWQHHTRAAGPDAFVAIAESSGIIAPLGDWILREACHHAAQWPSHLHLAVNLSPAQLGRPTLMATVLGGAGRVGAQGAPAGVRDHRGALSRARHQHHQAPRRHARPGDRHRPRRLRHGLLLAQLPHDVSGDEDPRSTAPSSRGRLDRASQCDHRGGDADGAPPGVRDDGRGGRDGGGAGLGLVVRVYAGAGVPLRQAHAPRVDRPLPRAGARDTAGRRRGRAGGMALEL